MDQEVHNNKHSRFSLDIKQSLALDALKSENISKTARDYNTTRSTVYNYRDIAVNAVNECIDDKNDNDVLYVIPVTKGYIKSVVNGLFGICKSSQRDSQLFLHDLFDYKISIGAINSILTQSSNDAHKINQSYSLERCKDSTSDECFHQGDPILSVADIPSKFCLLLERDDYIDHDVWEMYLDDLKERGYLPEVNVLDGGSEMNLAYKNQFETTTLRYDHFHIIKTIKELLRFLYNKRESAVSKALKSYRQFMKKQDDATKAAWETEVEQATFFEDVYANAETLLCWLQYDVLQLPAAGPDVRTLLFDFIIEELVQLSKKHPHRIRALITTLKNNKSGLLDAAKSLNNQFQIIADKHNVSIDTVWEICYLARYDINAPNYHFHANELDQQLGDDFDCIEDKVLSCMATTYRTSSVIENLNSRLRPFLDKRKGFKSGRYPLIQFMLNHLPLQRTLNPEHKGKSTAEIFVKQDLPNWMDLLGLTRFKRAA